MFDNFKEHIEKLQRQSALPVDMEKFDDPMAEKIDWHPMKPGGANFKTHVLKKKSSSQYKYGASVGAILFSGLFMTVGVLMFLTGTGILFNEADAPFVLVIFGIIFALVGFLFLKQLSVAINFDSMHGYLWKGNKRPQLSGNVQDKNAVIYFSEIYAIQIISERVKGSKSRVYYSHEINLILRDGKRFHVIDHGNHQQILEDVATLSQLINKPVWDASFS